MQKYLAILIVIVCTVLLQAHSIPFWHERFNSDYGSFWSIDILGIISYITSISIEFVAIYGWLSKRYILSYGTSIIVILVPLVHLSSPLIDELKSNETKTRLIAINDKRIEQNLKLQSKYIDTNWAGAIIKNDNSFNDLANEQERLLNHNNFNIIMMIIIEAWSLMMFFYAQVLSARSLAFRDFQTIEMQNFSNSEIVETPENRAKSLLIEMQKYIKEKDISGKELADRLAIPASNLSKLKNSISGAGESLSDKKIDEIKEKFERLL